MRSHLPSVELYVFGRLVETKSENAVSSDWAETCVPASEPRLTDVSCEVESKVEQAS
jgi:hypothetical protein